jgi:hypothetical protein
VVSALVGAGSPAQFFHSYLVSFLFFLSLALGGLFFVLLHFLTRAGWSVVVRRAAEQVAATLPLFLILFLPLLLGLEHLYKWTRPEAIAADPLLAHKTPWLESSFFTGRSLLYLALWGFLGWWYYRQSRRQDQMGAHAITRRMQTVSGPAMILFAVTVTLASFDWVVSLDAHWYSTIFGVYFFSGSAVGIFALLILIFLGLQRAGRLAGVVTWEHFHDLGKLLFAFVVFWAYIAFSQFMLIWYANIPETTLWYGARWGPGWQPLSLLLAAGHFGLPFLLLLSRDVKRRRGTLAAAAAWMLLMHWVDLHWLIMPFLHAEAFAPHLLDVTTFLGLGGLFAAAVTWAMVRQALVPTNDPRLPESLVFENV